MKLIIVRHGQTDDNVKKIVAGQSKDTVLNSHGVLQAQKLAALLKKEKIDIAYVSDFKRAIKTAQEILHFHPKVKLIKNKKLRERHFGNLEGMVTAEAVAIMEKSELPFELFKPKGGESHAEVYDRVGKFFATLAKKHKNDTVLVVSHARAITLLLLNILQKPIHKENQQAHRPENTGFTILEIIEGQPIKVQVLNSLKHLD